MPSASAQRPRERKSAEFLFQVLADLSAERHSPFCARARQCRNLFSLVHPPSFFHAVPNSTASASAFNDGLQASGIPAALVFQSSVSCTRVPSWPSVRRFSIYPWLYLDVGPAIGKFIFTSSRSFPPASFSLLALFQTFRRHRCRLLRQRLDFSTPSRVVVTSDLEDVGRARIGSANTPVAGMVTSPRRRLVKPEHCARRCVQCHRKL